MTTLQDQLDEVGQEARLVNPARLASVAVAGAQRRRTRRARAVVVGVPALLVGTILLSQQRFAGQSGVVGVPGTGGTPGAVPHSTSLDHLVHHELIGAIVAGVAALVLTGAWAARRGKGDPPSWVERLVSAVWGASFGSWAVSFVWIMGRLPSQSNAWESAKTVLLVLLGGAVGLAVVATMVAGGPRGRRLAMLAAATASAILLVPVDRYLADIGYWPQQWATALSTVQALVGVVGLVWLWRQREPQQAPARGWILTTAYLLSAVGVAIAYPFPFVTLYPRDVWGVVAAGAAGVATAAGVGVYLRRSASRGDLLVVGAAALLATNVPVVSLLDIATLPLDWRWLLPLAVAIGGVVLVPVLLVLNRSRAQ